MIQMWYQIWKQLASKQPGVMGNAVASTFKRHLKSELFFQAIDCITDWCFLLTICVLSSFLTLFLVSRQACMLTFIYLHCQAPPSMFCRGCYKNSVYWLIDLKIFKTHFKYDLRNFYFTNRVVDAWNSLPNWIVMANSTNTFKRRLDWQDQEIIYDFHA